MKMFLLETFSPLIIVFIVFLIILLSTFIFGAFLVLKMTKKVRNLGKRTPKDVGLDFEEHWIPTKEGHRLHAWFIPRGSDKTIIIAHGYSSTKSHDPYPEGEHYCFFTMKMLAESGYNVFLFDFRAHGKSEGEYTTIGPKEADDIIAVIDWLKENKEENASKIGLIGYSMGGAATIFAITKDDRINAAIADSPYADLGKAIRRMLARKHMKFLYPILKFWAKRLLHLDPDKVSPAEAAKDIKAPLFIIVGTEDYLVSVDDARKIYENAKMSGREVELWIVEGAKHVRSHIKEPEEYKKRVLEWFSRHLQ